MSDKGTIEPRDFVFWLQGFAELNDQPPTAEQWKSIKEHLARVFYKVTPELQMKELESSPGSYYLTRGLGDGLIC